MDDVISRYPGDTTITSFIDDDGCVYVNTPSFIIGLNNSCTKIKMMLYEDWGEGIQRARVTYLLYGNLGNVTTTQLFTDENSNSYMGCHAFISSKYLFWYFCDQNSIAMS